MSVVMTIKRIWAGYPGGYQSTATGTMPVGKALPFTQPADPNDLRSKIPPLMAQGGFLPAFDDMLLQDMRLDDIVYCPELVRGHVP